MEILLASIKPQWLDLILSGQKTIELRKSSPLHPVSQIYWHRSGGQGIHAVSEWLCFGHNVRLSSYSNEELEILSRASCMPIEDIMDYAVGGALHLWHIAKTSPLNEAIPDGIRPPQSWRYLYKEASK